MKILLGKSGQVGWELRSLREALAVRDIAPISTSAYSVRAMRPQNSRLDTRQLREGFSSSLPYWQVCVSRVLKEKIGARR